MRIGILTSVETRHRYFVQAVRARFNVTAVAYEQTGYSPADVDAHDLTRREAGVIAEHFVERARQEMIFFGAQADVLVDGPLCPVRHMRPGELNSHDTLTFLESSSVDAVVVFGTNLIRTPLLERFAGRIVNLHLGLSPYYRGTGTNFYPLVNEEPQYVGATIHVINAGTDSGPILAHARPEIVANDGPHTLGCKAIQAGIDKLLHVLPEWREGQREPVPQWPVSNARVYLRKDYHPLQVVELYKKLESGMIGRYVERARHQPIGFRLIE